MAKRPGPVVLFGSGETSSSGQKAFDWLFSQLDHPLRLAILETPAGFQPNSQIVARQIEDFVREHLQNYHPETSLVPARKRGTELSPDNPLLLHAMDGANAVFLGPGSPTYAARQLRDTLAWRQITKCHLQGVGLALASAAAIAVGSWALPVYEIYKAGEDLHWQSGLDLFGAFGLSLVFIPHWNNTEGGAKLDTSRCYMGEERFERLLEILPEKDMTVVGIDEHTALGMDLEARYGKVIGSGNVHIRHNNDHFRFKAGREFPLESLGSYRIPVSPVDQSGRCGNGAEELPETVSSLLKEREAARVAHEWSRADALRDEISRLGWQVVDTPEGSKLVKIAK